jgi:hypothetical protein
MIPGDRRLSGLLGKRHRHSRIEWVAVHEHALHRRRHECVPLSELLVDPRWDAPQVDRAPITWLRKALSDEWLVLWRRTRAAGRINPDCSGDRVHTTILESLADASGRPRGSIPRRARKPPSGGDRPPAFYAVGRRVVRFPSSRGLGKRLDADGPLAVPAIEAIAHALAAALPRA